jgi:hypothetical protein
MALSKLDHAALLQCLPDNGDDDWYERAEWACWVLQVRDLNLRPWQVAPCDVDLAGDNPEEAAARQLLRRMLAMGMSRYDPNPSQALQFA